MTRKTVLFKFIFHGVKEKDVFKVGLQVERYAMRNVLETLL